MKNDQWIRVELKGFFCSGSEMLEGKSGVGTGGNKVKGGWLKWNGGYGDQESQGTERSVLKLLGERLSQELKSSVNQVGLVDTDAEEELWRLIVN